MADTTVPAPAARRDGPWVERCAARLEAKRLEWARTDPDFADAYVRVEKVNDGRAAVGLHTIDNFRRKSGFWIEVYDNPVHSRPDSEMRHWGPIESRLPLTSPVIVRHLHPRTARMQPEAWVPTPRWQAFSEAWQPLVDACLRD